jgi:hypothetical protein
MVATGAPASLAGERADWGRVVSVGDMDEGAMLLIENDRGMHTLFLDPEGEVRTRANERTTLANIKPGDHIDFAVSPWAGMQIVDLVVVTPPPTSQAKLP